MSVEQARQRVTVAHDAEGYRASVQSGRWCSVSFSRSREEAVREAAEALARHEAEARRG